MQIKLIGNSKTYLFKLVENILTNTLIHILLKMYTSTEVSLFKNYSSKTFNKPCQFNLIRLTDVLLLLKLLKRQIRLVKCQKV